MYLDSRLWAFTKGVRLRIAWAVLVGLLAVAVGIARLGLMGWLLGRVFSGESIESMIPPIALVAGAMLLALGIVIAGAISGPFVDLTTDLLLIAKASTQGIVMLLAIRLLSSKFILRTTNIKHEIVTDHNHAAALKHAFALVAMAIVTRAIIF